MTSRGKVSQPVPAADAISLTAMLCPIPVLGCIGHLDTLGHLGSPCVTLGHLGSPWVTLGAWDFERNNKMCEFPRLKVKILLSQLCVGPRCQFQKTPHGKMVSTWRHSASEVIPLFAQAEGCTSNIGTMTQRKVTRKQCHFFSVSFTILIILHIPRTRTCWLLMVSSEPGLGCWRRVS